MGDTSIGTLKITIRGDWSQLSADIAAAQSVAARGGQQMSASFNQAADGADKVVFAIGRLAGVIEQESAAMSLSFQRNIAQLANFQRSLGGVGQAAQGAGINLRYLTFAVKDIAEGRSTYALAEMVNVASRLPAVFAGVAAGIAVMLIPLGEAIAKTKALSENQKELAEFTRAADDAFRETERTLTQLTVKQVGDSGGAAAGKRAELEALRQQAAAVKRDIDDAKDKIGDIAYAGASSIKNYVPILGDYSATRTQGKIKEQAENVRNLNEQLREIEGRIDAARQDAGRTGTEEAGSQRTTQIAGQIAELQRHSEALRGAATLRIALAHEVDEAQVESEQDAGKRIIAQANEKLDNARATETAISAIIRDETAKRVALIRAQGESEAAGRARPEQERIHTETENKVAAVQGDSDKERLALHAETMKAEAALDVAYVEANRGWAKQISEFWARSAKDVQHYRQEQFIQQNLPGAIQTLSGQRVGETNAKASGDQEALQIEAKKIALEGQYGSQVTHTLRQQLDYMRELAVLEDKERAAKIAGLQGELQKAQIDAASVAGTEKQIEADVKVAELEAEIAKSTQESANARQQSANAISREAADKSLNGQLQQSFHNIPSSVGNAAAAGIVNGKGIGQDIRNSLKGIGQQMLGDVFSKLIASILIQTGIQAAFNAIFPIATTAQVVATTANTIALGVNTAAILTQIALLGFADGGTPPVGVPSIVGERGPELFVPHTAGTIIPNHMLKGYADGAGLSYLSSSTSHAMHVSGPIHIHGVKDVDGMMRGIQRRAKRLSPTFSPGSH